MIKILNVCACMRVCVWVESRGYVEILTLQPLIETLYNQDSLSPVLTIQSHDSIALYRRPLSQLHPHTTHTIYSHTIHPTPQTLAIHTHPQASCTCVDDGHLQ